jgi:hypothetical protein
MIFKRFLMVSKHISWARHPVTDMTVKGEMASDHTYLGRGLQITAWPAGQESAAIDFLANSWVHDAAGERVFFQGMPLLPSQTPEGLKELRAKELSDIRVSQQRFWV